MASPTAIGGAGVGANAAGAVIGAYGAYEGGEAQSKMYGYQAQVARINSQIDLQNADYARETGEVVAQQYGRKAGQVAGQIKASQGAGNLDVNSGSNKDVQTSQAETTRIDLSQIRSNAAKTAYDFDVKSTEDINQAGLYDTASTNAVKAGELGAVASLVGGAGSVSSKWLAGQQQGLWGGSGSSGGGDNFVSYGPGY